MKQSDGYGLVANPQMLIGSVGAFCLHLLTVYLCALHLSPWIVGHTFNWLLATFKVLPQISPADWYLQHLTLISIIPALLVGYLAALRMSSTATWVWLVPTAWLAYKMIQYSASGSVFGTSMSAYEFFFAIQKTMPNSWNWTTTNPVRVLAQMTVTAPFYSGMAYSLGALLSKHKLIVRLVEWLHPRTD